jgi:hypothetical protein
MGSAVKFLAPVKEMAEELWKESAGKSGPELSDLVGKIMMKGGYNPQDSKIRTEIGEIFRQISRSVG